MMIRPIDQQYFDRSPSKSLGRSKTAKSASDDNNKWNHHSS